jgi:hypothetical protein
MLFLPLEINKFHIGKMKKGLNTITILKKDSYHLAKSALKIIWISGIICITIDILSYLNFFMKQSNKESQRQKTEYRQQGATSIDQLLLSSDEALLTDKKSFVNGALRFQWRNQEPDLNQGNNRIILYDNILKKKLQRIPRASVSDFSIKPVPK